MEGYYWRLSDPASGRCVIALCGVCRAPGVRGAAPAGGAGGSAHGHWAVVALAVQDGRLRDDVAVVVLRSTPFDQPPPGASQPA